MADAPLVRGLPSLVKSFGKNRRFENQTENLLTELECSSRFP